VVEMHRQEESRIEDRGSKIEKEARAANLTTAPLDPRSSILDPRSSVWARLFPPERYPRGFSAPECFDARRPRDRHTDIYGWATIAYFLLTGDRPAQLAMNQGQQWARFEDPQFFRLDRALRTVPPAHVCVWAEQLGVDADALVQSWPRNFLTV